MLAREIMGGLLNSFTFSKILAPLWKSGWDKKEMLENIPERFAEENCEVGMVDKVSYMSFFLRVTSAIHFHCYILIFNFA